MSIQCTRKTYPTSGNNFPTLKYMIGNMGLLFSFCLQKNITNSSSLQSSFISSHDYFIS